jgi:hypothetical protein
MVCDGDPPCSMYFETVDWATSKPSITLAKSMSGAATVTLPGLTLQGSGHMALIMFNV